MVWRRHFVCRIETHLDAWGVRYADQVRRAVQAGPFGKAAVVSGAQGSYDAVVERWRRLTWETTPVASDGS